MDKKHLEDLAASYTFDAQGIIRNTGKFEGETLATLYYYDAYLNGDGCIQMVAEDESKEFGINALYVYLAESNNGFVSLVFCDTEEQAEELDEMNFFDEYSDIDTEE